MKCIFGVLLFFLFISCGTESGLQTIEVGEDFQPYFELFEAEGKARGLENLFSDQGIKIQFGDPDVLVFGDPEFTAGYCDLVSSPPIVNINKSLWDILNERNKEFIILHELGHCVLKRQHITDLLPNKEMKSIMTSGDFENIEGNKVLNYSGFRKQYYLDELFDASVDSPQWAKRINSYNEIADEIKQSIEELRFQEIDNKWLPDFDNCLSGKFIDSILLIKNICSEPKAIYNSIESFTDTNFEIEIELKILGDGQVNLKWGGSNEQNQMQLGIEKDGSIKFGFADVTQGVFALIRAKNWIPNIRNVINVIKKNNIYYLFVNGEFFYENDFYTLKENSVGIELETENSIEISALNVYKFE